MAAAFGRHGLERGERAADVVAVVAARIAHRIRHRQPGGEMHHGRRAAVADRAADGVDVADVAFDHRRAERGAAMSGGEDCRR